MRGREGAVAVPKARRFDFYPDDWLAGTRGLNASERGIYITACALIYSHGGPIAPDDLRASCPGDLRVYRKCLERLIELGKLDLKRGYLSNKRCLSEVQLASKRVVKAVKNARKRWGETVKTNDLRDATSDAAQQSLPSPSPSPSPPKKKEREGAHGAQDSLSPDLKDEWVGEARQARSDSDLPPTNLKAELAKYLAVKREPERGDFIRWALNARSNGRLEGNPDAVNERDRPTGPPPPIEPRH